MALMREGALAGGAARTPEIETIVTETEAVAAALAAAEPGDLIVMTATDVPGVWRQVTDFRPPRPADVYIPQFAAGAARLAVGH